MKKQLWFPVTPSDVAGKLGVLHIPRMYDLMNIDAHGRLPKGYNAKAKSGFNGMVADGIGLDLDAAAALIATERPTEEVFEDWIGKTATGYTPENVAKLNAAILAYEHDDVTRANILKLWNVPDDKNAPRTAVALNKMEDAALAREARLKDLRRKFQARKAGKTVTATTSNGSENKQSTSSETSPSSSAPPGQQVAA